MDRSTLTRMLVGLVGWAALMASQDGGWWITSASILLFGLLVLSPLAFHLAMPPAFQAGHLYRTGQYLQPFAALITSASFFLPAGVLSATFAIAWLPVSALLAIGRIRNGQNRCAEESAISLGFISLLASAFYLWADRMSLFGGSMSGALSLANHLFFAGFGGLLLAGLIGRKVREEAAHIPPAVKFVVLLQVLLTAAFFWRDTGTSTIKAAVLVFQLLGQISLAWLLLSELRHSIQKSSARRILFAAIASMTVSTIVLLISAAGLVSKFFYLPTPIMMTAHGWLTAVGFIGGGLLVFMLEYEF